jgi:acetyl esterase
VPFRTSGVVTGGSLSPGAQALMTQILARFPDGKRILDVEAMRRNLLTSAPPADVPPVERVTELSIPASGGAPAIPMRAYLPLDAAVDPPLLVFFHGGGWVMCNLDTHDSMCRRLANGSAAVVVAVDYRLAPEAPFPAALEDACSAVNWVQAHGAELGGDPSRIGVVGDSAGGNLAAVVPLVLRDRGGVQVSLQVLIYPVVDGRLTTPSYTEFADGGGNVTRDEMDWFWRQYIGEADRTNPYASPLLADLGSLPPALVVVAECDPLRDEGALYARKLRDAGSEVTFSQYDGVFHGFFGMTLLLPEAAQANDEVCNWIRGIFKGKSVHGDP